MIGLYFCYSRLEIASGSLASWNRNAAKLLWHQKGKMFGYDCSKSSANGRQNWTPALHAMYLSNCCASVKLIAIFT